MRHFTSPAPGSGSGPGPGPSIGARVRRDGRTDQIIYRFIYVAYVGRQAGWLAGREARKARARARQAQEANTAAWW